MRVVPAVVLTLAMTNIASTATVITPIIADVSSENPVGIDRDADHTVDGSGMSGPGMPGDTHGNVSDSYMWTSEGNLGSPEDYDPYITYELGEIRDVTVMRIWNYNTAGFKFIGPNEVDVYTGTNGTDFTFAQTVNFAEAPGTVGYTGLDIAVNYIGVRYIKFDIMTNHDGAVFDGTGAVPGADGRSLTGLSEVRFEALRSRADNPDPDNGETMVKVNKVLAWDAPETFTPIRYDVYLDPTEAKVEAGDLGCEYVSLNQPGTTFNPSPDLAYDTKYFWRVDPISPGSGAVTGDVWYFTTHQQPMTGDLNGDWKVDLIDLAISSGQWLDPAGCVDHLDDCADLIGEDGVNLHDLACLAENWFQGTVPSVVISEFLASNSSKPGDADGLVDQDGDSSDWIEIHNLMDTPVSLDGWYLTDKDDEPAKWQFPDVVIEDYLVVFASGKNRSDPEDELHTNFLLSADGEYLALVRPDGQTVASEYAPEFSEQVTDVSYGIYDEQLRYFDVPTPGEENAGPGLIDIVGAPDFSVSRGFYENSFELYLSCQTTGAAMRYTVDGSVPTESSTAYTGPITIANTKCVRAAAFKDGYLQSATQTHTYIFPANVILQSTLDDLIMNDPVWGVGLDDVLLELPTISLVTPHSISEAEKETSIELIFPDGSEGFQYDAGLERFGGHSLGHEKASLRISFKEIYGPGKLDFDLFGQCAYGGQNATTEFDQVLLRSGAHDAMFWVQPDSGVKGAFVRNRWIMDRQLEMGQPAPRGRFVHVYINGVYWGQYHLMERPNASFMASYLGGEKEDYDAVKGNLGTFSVINGNVDAWNAMVSATNNYETLQQYMDIVNYVDYMLVNFYGGNDWDWKIYQNWMAARKRQPGEGHKFFCWDNDVVLRWHPDADLVNTLGGPGNMWFAVKQHEEVRMIMADRAHKYFFNNGILTRDRVLAQFDALAETIEKTIILECARWGRYGLSYEEWFWDPFYYTPDSWQEAIDWIKTQMVDQRTDLVVQQLRDARIYPLIDAPVFNINGSYQHGGHITEQDELSITAQPGTIYYTLDGSDPRDNGVEYTVAITLGKSTRVKARLFSGDTWSALNEVVYAIPSVAENLRITEIMYHPADPNAEFIELKNIGTTTINPTLVKFANGIYFTFPSCELEPNDYVLVAESPAELATLAPDIPVGVEVLGPYTGKLDNDGEKIALADAIGQTIHEFRYKDGWYDITDGDGFSLTIKDPAGTDPNLWADKSGWRPSAAIGGSPGRDDTGDVPEIGAVKINEILAHSDQQQYDWIELYNTTDEPINIGGWFLSDNNDDDPNRMKYEITENIVIEPNNYIVFSENLHFANPLDAGCHSPFRFSENGETAYLQSGRDGGLTGYYEEENFGASEADVAFGRHQKSTGTFNFVAMSVNTLGYDNAYPRVGPIVINEIMYNPPVGGLYEHNEYEFVELYNISDSEVYLEEYDNEQHVNVSWKFTDGIDYTFPQGTSIVAHSYLLVVRNPDAFIARYGAPTVTMLGPYSGKLNSSGEKLEISKPGDEVDGTRCYIRVDRVNYSDGSHPAGEDPWPVEADGAGDSLQQKTPNLIDHNYGNDVLNWEADTPTPGEAKPE